MFESIMNFFKRITKSEEKANNSKNAAKERLHLVLMQDRANVSADFLELMKQEIIEVIKKYIEVDENAIDVRLTNKENEDGTTGAPALYANIPITNIKSDMKKESEKVEDKEEKIEVKEENVEEVKENIEEVQEELKEDEQTKQQEEAEEVIEDNDEEEQELEEKTEKKEESEEV